MGFAKKNSQGPGKSVNLADIPDDMLDKFLNNGKDEQVRKSDEKRKTGKGGRPKKAPEDKREEPLNVYLTEDEKETVAAYCQKIGTPFSALTRQLLYKEGILK